MALSRALVTDAELRRHSKYGVIRVADLELLGIPQVTSYRRCQPGGPWTHMLPGIVLLARGHPNARQRVEAALMHTDGFGVITGFEAARRYGLKDMPAGQTVHVLIPDAHRFSSTRFAQVERTKFMPETRLLNGVPLAPPVRAVLDGVRRLRELDPVRALLIESVQARLCTVDELSHELDSGSRRGTALPRSVLRQLVADTRSVPEATAKSLWVSARLPPAEQNVKIYLPDGTYVGMPDLFCDEIALAWEIDSYNLHFDRAAFKATLERNNRYASAGVTCVQTLPSRLRLEPDKVVAELRAAYEAARRRPRPPVVVVRPNAAA